MIKLLYCFGLIIALFFSITLLIHKYLESKYLDNCFKQILAPVSKGQQQTNDKYNLVISYSFHIEQPHRKEIDYCILRNMLQMPVWILLDNSNPQDECLKLKTDLTTLSIELEIPFTKQHFHCQYRIGQQPSYYDMVKYARTLSSEYVIISNADIFFDQTIEKIQLKEGEAYGISWSKGQSFMDNHIPHILRGSETHNSMCLTPEHPVCALEHDFFIVNCWPDRLYSIDSFVFRRKTLNNISPDGFYEYKTKNQYKMNRIGAEHSFIGALIHQNISITNPCRFIKTYHAHEAKKTSKNHPPQPLFSKYGIYSTRYYPKMHNKKKVQHVLDPNLLDPNHEFFLPVGI